MDGTAPETRQGEALDFLCSLSRRGESRGRIAGTWDEALDRSLIPNKWQWPNWPHSRLPQGFPDAANEWWRHAAIGARPTLLGAAPDRTLNPWPWLARQRSSAARTEPASASMQRAHLTLRWPSFHPVSIFRFLELDAGRRRPARQVLLCRSKPVFASASFITDRIAPSPALH